MLKNGKVLAIIPARGGSKELPKKNILMAKEKPLIWYSFSSAVKSKNIDRVILSSDDNEIISVAENFGLEAPFKRPKNLADDEASTFDVISHALKKLPGYEYVVLLQPTSPLRTHSDIDDCLEKLELCNAPACVTVVEPKHRPEWMFTVDNKDRLTPVMEKLSMRSRRQDLSKTFSLNGAVYAARVDWLMDKKSFLSEGCIASIMPPERSLDIDTLFDFQLFLKCLNE